MCLAQGHNVVVPVRLKPATPRSPLEHTTTKPLRSLAIYAKYEHKQMRGADNKSRDGQAKG